MFLDGGQQGLKGKNRAGGELMRTRAKLGEMTMRVELQTELLEKRGYGDELRKRAPFHPSSPCRYNYL